MNPEELRRLVAALMAELLAAVAELPAMTAVQGTVDAISGVGPDAQVGVILDGADVSDPVQWGQIVGGSAPDVGTRVTCLQVPPSGLLVLGVSGSTGGAVTLGGDVAGPSSANVIQPDAVTTAKIIDDAVTNAKLANMAQSTIKGRAAGSGTGDPIDLTVAQVKAILALVAADISDFTEAVEDVIGAAVVATVPITAVYDDTSGDTTIALQGRQKFFHSVHEGMSVVASPDMAWSNNGGAGAATTLLASEANHFGIVALDTGTTTTGNARISGQQATVPFVIFGVSPWQLEAMIRIPTLSDGTETFTVRVGFNDSANGNGSDSVMFRYNHAVNGGAWELVARANAVETVTNSASAPAANTWYRLTIVVAADASSAEFFVDGVSIGTVAGLPSGAARGTSFNAQVTKSAGTTSRTVDVDYLEILGTVFTR